MSPIRIFAVGLLVLVWGPAIAGDAPKTIDRSQVRVITESQATSDCIGDPKTPLCAVETLIACFARQDRALCRRVGQPNFRHKGPPWISEYVHVSSTVIRAEEIRPDEDFLSWKKAGNLKVRLEMRTCDKSCQEETWSWFLYILAPAPGGWNVVSWTSEGEQEPDLPPSRPSPQ